MNVGYVPSGGNRNMTNCVVWSMWNNAKSVLLVPISECIL